MGDSLSTAKNKATTIMRCLVLIGSLLASSSASPFDAGYGAPIAPVVTAPAPVVHSIPAPVAPVPLQLVHNAPIVHSVPQPVVHSVPAPIAAPLPVVATAPVAAPVPVAPVVEPPSSQFHAQDEFGQFSFGYQNINSAKSETRDAFGVTRGSYQYVDANGVLQTVNYIADPVNGFRVAGTNIPVAPEVAPVAAPVVPIAPAAAPLVAPVAPVETPEVAAARAEHLAAHAEATAAASAADATSSIEKREAEPIDGDYEIPAAPVLRLPVPLVQNVPAPVINHVVHTAPVPVAPAPVATAFPTVFNDFRNFAPVNQVFAADQFAFVAPPAPVPQPAVAAPLAIAPTPLAAPVAIAPAPTPLAAPVPVAPIAPVAPIVEPPSSQFHAQDEFGQFSFGYQNISSAKTESKDAFGVTRGSYQYVDVNGILQTVNYIADPVNGFRVAVTN